jgi:hypothetical protein
MCVLLNHTKKGVSEAALSRMNVDAAAMNS